MSSPAKRSLAAVAVAVALLLAVLPGIPSQHYDVIGGHGLFGAGTSAAGDSYVFFLRGVNAGAGVPPDLPETSEPYVTSPVVCIGVGGDFGCGSDPGAPNADVDLLLTSGVVQVTVDSYVYPGGTLSADITATGQGPYVVASPLVFNPGSNQEPIYAELRAELYRNAVITGKLQSSTEGGGPITGTYGELFEGAIGWVLIDDFCCNQ
ncbi:MAG: hypothetical protein ACRDJM_05410 [Actinomycetota bacterium]